MPNPPELIFLPGLDGTGRSFRPLLDVIPPPLRDRCRVISYPGDRALSYDELLGLLQSQIAPDQRVVLVAESMGGPLALRYAAARPESVRAVVLAATFVRSPVPSWTRWIFTERFFAGPKPDWTYRLLLLDWRVSKEMVGWARDMMNDANPEVVARRVREVIRVDAREALRSYPGPILYLQGLRDRLVRKGNLRRILAIRPDVEVKQFDAPHMVLQVRPEEAWREIHAFLG